jgi:hypothetical protein
VLHSARLAPQMAATGFFFRLRAKGGPKNLAEAHSGSTTNLELGIKSDVSGRFLPLLALACLSSCVSKREVSISFRCEGQPGGFRVNDPAMEEAIQEAKLDDSGLPSLGHPTMPFKALI